MAKHVENMELFTENAKRKPRQRETTYPYRCSKCGAYVEAFLQIRGQCPCGGTYRLEEG